MTTTTESTFHSEPYELRIEELKFFCNLIAYAIKADLFRDDDMERQASCIHRIAEKI